MPYEAAILVGAIILGAMFIRGASIIAAEIRTAQAIADKGRERLIEDTRAAAEQIATQAEQLIGRALADALRAPKDQMLEAIKSLTDEVRVATMAEVASNIIAVRLASPHFKAALDRLDGASIGLVVAKIRYRVSSELDEQLKAARSRGDEAEVARIEPLLVEAQNLEQELERELGSAREAFEEVNPLAERNVEKLFHQVGDLVRSAERARPVFR